MARAARAGPMAAGADGSRSGGGRHASDTGGPQAPGGGRGSGHGAPDGLGGPLGIGRARCGRYGQCVRGCAATAGVDPCTGPRPGRRVPVRVQPVDRCVHRCLRHRLGDRLGGQRPGCGHLSRRDVRGPVRRLVPGLRVRSLRRSAHHLDGRRRLSAGPDHQVRVRRCAGVHHRVRRPAGDRRPSLRRRLRQGGRGQPHRPCRHGRPRSILGTDPHRHRSGHRGTACVGRPRLRGGRRPVRPVLSLARGPGVGRCRRLRAALRPHEELLGPAAGRDRRGRGARCRSRRRLSQRVHHHADRPERQRPEHRRQRLRERVQPRRDRHPLQPVHAGLLHRCPCTAARGPQRRRLGPVHRRHLDVLGALGGLPHEDRRRRLREGQFLLRGTVGRLPAQHRGRGPPAGRRPDRTGGHHGGHRRHRHPGVLDHRRLRGPAGTGGLPLPGRRDRGHRRGHMGGPAVPAAPDGHRHRAGRHHPAVRAGLPALLPPPTQHRQPVRRSRGCQLDVTVRELGLGG